MRTVIDILVALLLGAVLLWCAFLLLGAYSQHRLAILVNADVLKEMKEAIEAQAAGATPALKTKTTQEIERLQDAQERLFDANTISFIFQFVSLLILTIGVAVLGLMYSHYRQEQERATKAEKATRDLIRVLPSFISGRNTTAVIACKYCLLYALCLLFQRTSKTAREPLLVAMGDYQGDIQRHLEDAIREKEGLEPLLHEVILDMADRVKHMLLNIAGTVSGPEKMSADRVLARSSACRDLIWDNGEEFMNRYKGQWEKINGDERTRQDRYREV